MFMLPLLQFIPFAHRALDAQCCNGDSSCILQMRPRLLLGRILWRHRAARDLLGPFVVSFNRGVDFGRGMNGSNSS